MTTDGNYGLVCGSWVNVAGKFSNTRVDFRKYGLVHGSWVHVVRRFLNARVDFRWQKAARSEQRQERMSDSDCAIDD